MAVVLESAFPRGTAPIHAYGALDDQGAPIVLLFMDAFGPRPALDKIAEQLVNEGYRVLIPDLFYDHLPYVPLNPKSVFSGGDDRQRLSTLFGAIDQAKIDADIQVLLAFCTARFGNAPIGVTGYCMGGRYALTAATMSDRVVFAAAFHGSKLAPESGDGPHRRFAGTKSRIYVGVAENDPTFGATEEGRLATALREAKADHMIETYAGAAHGFVMDDLPVANAAAASHHWLRLSTQLREAFSHSSGARILDEQLLAARAAIADLVHTYALNIRTGNGAACAKLFTEDAVFEVREALVATAEPSRTRSKLIGREAITHYVARTGAPEMRVCPLIHNLLIHVHGHEANSTCVMTSLVWASGKQLIGEYQDSYRYDNGWRFTSRIFTILGEFSFANSQQK